MSRQHVEQAPFPDAAEKKRDLAYYDLGDFIYDQNPYGGFGEPDPAAGEHAGGTQLAGQVDPAAREAKPAAGRMRLAEHFFVAGPSREPISVVDQYEEARKGKAKPDPEAPDKFDEKSAAFESPDLGVRAIGAVFNSKDTYRQMLPPHVAAKTGLRWEFNGQVFRVSKAMRIRYTVRDATGGTVSRYLLVGYEGGGGM